MKKTLCKLFERADSRSISHFDINEITPVSHFNWFARYDTSHDETKANKSKD